MEGRVFMKMVHDCNNPGEATLNQRKLGRVSPCLQVQARSSPDDKLTLAKEPNVPDRERCRKLKVLENIDVFPDRQVLALTGDGTNNAPALRNANGDFAKALKARRPPWMLRTSFCSTVTSPAMSL